MFQEKIFRTPFTTQAAEIMYGSMVYGRAYREDMTLIATMRALLNSRMKPGDTLYVCTNEYSWDKSTVERVPMERFIRSMRDIENNTICVSNISCDDETAKVLYDGVESGFSGDGWVKVDAVTDFFRKSFDVLCFINEAKRTSVFFVKKMTMRMYHMLQSAAITSVPWYFNPKNGDRLTEDELELLRSFNEKSPDRYLACLKKIADALDFETEFLRKQLTGIESAFERRMVTTLESQLDEIANKITQYQNAISDIMRTAYQKNIELLGYRTKLAEDNGESPLMNYFSTHKNIVLDNVSDNTIVYHINTYMTYFDEGMARKLISNKNSILYEYSPQFPAKFVADVMRALFIEEKIRLRLCAAYSLCTTGSCNGDSHHDFHDDAADRMPNPHIQQYACIGDYSSGINRSMQNHDYVGAIELTIASASSISLTDGAVMRHFFTDLFRNASARWFEAPDGTKMNLRELADYLNINKEGTEDEQDH